MKSHGFFPKEVDELTNFEFGLTLTVVGMGGTLIILYLISLTVSILNKIFPYWERRKARE